MSDYRVPDITSWQCAPVEETYGTALMLQRERDTLRAGIEAIVSDLDAISKHSDFCRTDCAILATKARKLLEAKDGYHEW